jgi:hypothetical protein
MGTAHAMRGTGIFLQTAFGRIFTERVDAMSIGTI